MLKAWDFTKNSFRHKYIDNNLQKIFQTNVLEKGTGQILFIVVLMVDLWLKLQLKIDDENDSIFTCLPSIHIFL